MPHPFADHTVGKKSAKAAEKTEAPLASAAEPVSRASQGACRALLPRGPAPRARGPGDMLAARPLAGDVEKAVTELIMDFDVNPEEESPYEALYNATSCHSLDSLASGRSSDRESVSKEVESAALKAAAVRPVRSRACSSLLAQDRELGSIVMAAQLAAGPPARGNP